MSEFAPILRRVAGRRDTTLTQDEAIDVWAAMHEIVRVSEVPEAAIIHCLYDRLSRELNKGERCAVCGRHKDDECAWRC